MSQALHPMLNTAVKAARAAGAIINRAALDLEMLSVARKGPNDFVSDVDRAAEQAILDILLEAYPDHSVLAEESGRERGARNSEYLWIVDPLDGTTNFLHGFPVYAVSIALAHRGVVQQAVVYDPTRNDLFIASRGRGAFLNDRRLRVSRRTRLADGLVGTGFPFRKGDNFPRYVKMFEEVMQSCAGLRRPGAAALDLCYVAAGYYDGFFEMGLSPWDAAAGSLMITEAGGLVGNFTGEADYLYQRELVAGNPRVYGQLVKILQPYTRVIKTAEEAGAPQRPGQDAAAEPADATQAFVDAAGAAEEAGTAPATPGEATPPRRIVRVPRADAAPPTAKPHESTRPREATGPRKGMKPRDDARKPAGAPSRRGGRRDDTPD